MTRLNSKLIFFDSFSIKNHFLIIAVFIGLTALMTFPVIWNFTSEFAGIGGDTWAYVWSFWSLRNSIENNVSPFSSDAMFYPNGISFTQLTPFNSWIALLLIPVFGDIINWNILWFSNFVLAGYGAFVLSNYFHKNFFASLAAGIIFTFSSYHIAHGLGHLELITIFWIPFFILFLIKSSRSKSKINPILAGVFLFLVVMSNWYSLLFMLIFSLIFFILQSSQLEKIKFRTFLFHILIIFSVGIFLTLPITLPIAETISSNTSFDRPFSEFRTNSYDPVNMFLPSTLHSIGKILPFPYLVGDISQISYIGISVGILALISIIWYRNSFVWLWIASGVVFFVLSLGPELKIMGEFTGFNLPSLLLIENLPGWDFFRTPSRFMFMMTLVSAMLVSHSISQINKNYLKSNKIKWVFGIIILAIIIFEFSTIPYPTVKEPISPIYQTIREEPEKFAILEAPIGGSGEVGLLSDPTFLYYQTIHEKPIYGGYLARVPIDNQRFSQTYFLNQFVWYNEDSDIVKQDLSEVGLSLFNYYNIGYVIIHKEIEWFWIQDFIDNQYIPDTKNIMREILGEDEVFYEDQQLIAYKIPKSNSVFPFLVLDSGWENMKMTGFGPERSTGEQATLQIINPSNEIKKVELLIKLKAVGEPRTISILINDSKMMEDYVTTDISLISTGVFTINPGVNNVEFMTEGFIFGQAPSEYEKAQELSMKFYSISLL